MDCILITTQFAEKITTFRPIRADEMRDFAKAVIQAHKKEFGQKIGANDVVGMVNIRSMRVLRSTGKVWDQLVTGDAVWLVTASEWKKYSDDVLQRTECKVRHGRRLQPRTPNVMSPQQVQQMVMLLFPTEQMVKHDQLLQQAFASPPGKIRPRPPRSTHSRKGDSARSSSPAKERKIDNDVASPYLSTSLQREPERRPLSEILRKNLEGNAPESVAEEESKDGPFLPKQSAPKESMDTFSCKSAEDKSPSHIEVYSSSDAPMPSQQICAPGKPNALPELGELTPVIARSSSQAHSSGMECDSSGELNNLASQIELDSIPSEVASIAYGGEDELKSIDSDPHQIVPISPVPLSTDLVDPASPLAEPQYAEGMSRSVTGTNAESPLSDPKISGNSGGYSEPKAGMSEELDQFVEAFADGNEIEEDSTRDFENYLQAERHEEVEIDPDDFADCFDDEIEIIPGDSSSVQLVSTIDKDDHDEQKEDNGLNSSLDVAIESVPGCNNLPQTAPDPEASGQKIDEHTEDLDSSGTDKIGVTNSLGDSRHGGFLNGSNNLIRDDDIDDTIANTQSAPSQSWTMSCEQQFFSEPNDGDRIEETSVVVIEEVKDSDGLATGKESAVQGISSQMALEEKIQVQAEELAEAKRMKTMLEARLEETRQLLSVFAGSANNSARTHRSPMSKAPSWLQNGDIETLERTLQDISVETVHEVNTDPPSSAQNLKLRKSLRKLAERRRRANGVGSSDSSVSDKIFQSVSPQKAPVKTDHRLNEAYMSSPDKNLRYKGTTDDMKISSSKVDRSLSISSIGSVDHEASSISSVDNDTRHIAPPLVSMQLPPGIGDSADDASDLRSTSIDRGSNERAGNTNEEMQCIVMPMIQTGSDLVKGNKDKAVDNISPLSMDEGALKSSFHKKPKRMLSAKFDLPPIAPSSSKDLQGNNFEPSLSTANIPKPNQSFISVSSGASKLDDAESSDASSVISIQKARIRDMTRRTLSNRAISRDTVINPVKLNDSMYNLVSNTDSVSLDEDQPISGGIRPVESRDFHYNYEDFHAAHPEVFFDSHPNSPYVSTTGTSNHVDTSVPAPVISTCMHTHAEESVVAAANAATTALRKKIVLNSRRHSTGSSAELDSTPRQQSALTPARGVDAQVFKFDIAEDIRGFQEALDHVSSSTSPMREPKKSFNDLDMREQESFIATLEDVMHRDRNQSMSAESSADAAQQPYVDNKRLEEAVSVRDVPGAMKVLHEVGSKDLNIETDRDVSNHEPHNASNNVTNENHPGVDVAENEIPARIADDVTGESSYSPDKPILRIGENTDRVDEMDENTRKETKGSKFVEEEQLELLFSYIRPLLLTYRFLENSNVRGQPARNQLLHRMTDCDLLNFSIFQLYGTVEGFMVKGIKTTQIIRALKDAGVCGALTASQLDLLLTKINGRLQNAEKHQTNEKSKKSVALVKKTGTVEKKLPPGVKRDPAVQALNFVVYMELMRAVTSKLLAKDAKVKQRAKNKGIVLGDFHDGDAYQSNDKAALDGTMADLCEKWKSVLRTASHRKELEILRGIALEAKISMSGVLLKSSYKKLSARIPLDGTLHEEIVDRFPGDCRKVEQFVESEVEAVRHVWERNSDQIRQIYSYYANSLEVRRFGCGPMKLLMSIESCREMLSDFQVLPHVIDAHGFLKLFRVCKYWEFEVCDQLLEMEDSIIRSNSADSGGASHSPGHGSKSGFSHFLNDRVHHHDHHNSKALVKSPSMMSMGISSVATGAIGSAEDPLDILGSMGNTSLTLCGFLELITRIAIYKHKLGSDPHRALENLMRIMDASDGKAKLIRSSRKSTSVRHFVYGPK